MVSEMTAAQQRIHRAALELFAERGVTHVNVSDLAQAAGVARGTIYNNLPDPDALFSDVAAQLAADMNERVTLSFEGIVDPAVRFSNGIRLYVRRAHEEPHWGRFLTRFAFSDVSLQHIWDGQPLIDLVTGLECKRFTFRKDQLSVVISMIACSVLGAMFLVLEGHKTWREAGADTAELILIALGIPLDEAKALASGDLPPLPASQRTSNG